MVVSTRVAGVTNKMIRLNSRMVVINVSRVPAIRPLLDRGRMILRKRRPHLAPATVAASSSSPATCMTEATPAREE